MYVFNQLDKKCRLSNMQFLQNQLIEINYGQNSILLKVFDFKNNQFWYVVCPKGGQNGTPGYFKKMEKYGLSNNNQVYNIGLDCDHLFWVYKYNVKTGNFINYSQMPWNAIYEVMKNNHELNLFKAKELELHHKKYFNLTDIQKQFDKAYQIYLAMKEKKQNKNNNIKFSIKNTNKKTGNIKSQVDDFDPIEELFFQNGKLIS